MRCHPLRRRPLIAPVPSRLNGTAKRPPGRSQRSFGIGAKVSQVYGKGTSWALSHSRGFQHPDLAALPHRCSVGRHRCPPYVPVEVLLAEQHKVAIVVIMIAQQGATVELTYPVPIWKHLDHISPWAFSWQHHLHSISHINGDCGVIPSVYSHAPSTCCFGPFSKGRSSAICSSKVVSSKGSSRRLAQSGNYVPKFINHRQPLLLSHLVSPLSSGRWPCR
jgi:hypothetical protein